MLTQAKSGKCSRSSKKKVHQTQVSITFKYIIRSLHQIEGRFQPQKDPGNPPISTALDSDRLRPRLQRSLDGLPLKENLNFLMVDPRDDLVSG